MASLKNGIVRAFASTCICLFIFISRVNAQFDYDLYIGTIDGSPFIVYACDTVDIPVFVSGPPIGSGTIPLLSLNQYISERLGGNFYLGNDYTFSGPQYLDQISRQNLTFDPSIWGEDTFHLADFTMVVSCDSVNTGYPVDALFTLGVIFADSQGYYIISPSLHISPLLIIGPNAAEGSIVSPDQFILNDPYPNPFNSSITIKFSLPAPADIRLSFYDISGREIRKFEFPNCRSGDKAIVWDGKDDKGNIVSSGTYFYRVNYGESSQSSRVTLVK